MTCQHTMTLGVYLLGALDPTERSEFESHLSYCDTCRGELVRLSPLPGLLNQITPEDFSDGLPPVDLAAGPVLTHAQAVTEPVPVAVPVQRVAEDVPDAPTPLRKKPTRRYWRVLTAAAVIVLLAAGGVFAWGAIQGESSPPPPPPGVTWSVAAGTTSVQARLVDHRWGTEIESEVHGLPPGRQCYLKVYDHNGRFEIAGWWGTDHDPNAEIPASTSMPRGDIAKLEYLLDDRETVVATIMAPGG